MRNDLPHAYPDDGDATEKAELWTLAKAVVLFVGGLALFGLLMSQ